MPNIVKCQCGAAFHAADNLANKTVACPSCGEPLVIRAQRAAKPNGVALHCETCGAGFRAGAHLAGQQVRCPNCGGVISVPGHQATEINFDPLSTPLSSSNAAPHGSPTRSQAPLTPPAGHGGKSSLRAKWERRKRWQLSPILKVGLVIFGGLFLLGGPVCGYFALSMVADAQETANWPHADGVITRSEVCELGIAISPDFKPDITYEYELNGQSHVGNRVRTNDGEFDKRSGAEQVVRRYPVGKKVRVYYNPTNPNNSMLEAGAGFQEYALVFVAFIMFAIGVSAYVFLFGFTE